MTDINDLRRILNLLAANTCNNADFARLYQILDSKQIIFVPGERSVGVGGSISDSVIITGDNNMVYKGPNAEVVYQIVQDVLESFKVSALLTHSEFSKSAVITAKKLACYTNVQLLVKVVHLGLKICFTRWEKNIPNLPNKW